MAILVGVVGTQVIPYLEKSRQAKDMQIVSAWNTAAMSAYSMNADKVGNKATVTIIVNGTGVTCGDSSEIEATFKSLIGTDITKLSDVKWSSKAGNQINKVESVIDVTNERVTTTVSVASGTNPFGVIENK
jgi:type IV pilus assembly protein PilA